jgi:hypothetical protein
VRAPGPVPFADDVYAVAWLAGDRTRAIDTAVVTLIGDGRLRVEPTGELSTAVLRYSHPVEAAVLDAVGRRAHRSVHTVRHRCAADERLTGFAVDLHRAGLLRRRHLARPGPEGPAWSPTDLGRQLLAAARERSDAGTALRVALGGLDAVPDQGLRARVFELPREPRRPGTGQLDLGTAQARADARYGWTGYTGVGDHAG